MYFVYFFKQSGQAPHTISSGRDNRVQASLREQQKQANTVTGAGGARLRMPQGVNNQDVILNDLLTLQASIEELMGE